MLNLSSVKLIGESIHFVLWYETIKNALDPTEKLRGSKETRRFEADFQFGYVDKERPYKCMKNGFINRPFTINDIGYTV